LVSPTHQWFVSEFLLSRAAAMSALLGCGLLCVCAGQVIRSWFTRRLAAAGVLALAATGATVGTRALVAVAERVGRERFGAWFGPGDASSFAPLGPNLWVPSDVVTAFAQLCIVAMVISAATVRQRHGA
jgi:hypothetical protein